MIGYYFITDGNLSRKGIINDVKNALAAGVKFVQYRNKFASTKELYEEGVILRKLCKRITFLVNDRVDIALGVNADGVHLGRKDLPYQTARRLLGGKKIIGLTVHSIKEAKEAQSLGADYIGVSPIFSTNTKKDAGEPVGLAILRKITEQTSIPVVAIGGVNLNNAKEVVSTGVSGICAISSVVTAGNIKEEISRLQALFTHPL